MGCICFALSHYLSIDDAGNYTDVISDFAGRHIFEANDEIIKYLKSMILGFETLIHP